MAAVPDMRARKMRVRRAFELARRLGRHPGWIAEHARLARDRRRGRGDFSLAKERDVFDDTVDVLAAVLGRDRPEVAEATAGLWMPDRIEHDHTAWKSRLPLLTILGTCTRLLRPEILIETGVERGFSSATILAALETNQYGRLHSIDLPPLGEDPTSFTGAVVPPRFKARWELHIGPSRQLLPRILEHVPGVDVFLHDADHTYASQLDEFRTVWPALRPGGLLLCDDVWNAAFSDFCAEVGLRPVFLRRWGDTDAVGLARRPLTRSS